MAYSSTGHKRRRSGTIVADRTPQIMAIPRAPSVVRVMSKRRTVKRVYTQNRNLVRFMGIQMKYDGTNVQYGVTGAYPMASDGSVVSASGYQWTAGSFGLVLRLADFNEYPDIKNSFDQYRIKSCSVTFIPARDQGEVNSSFQLPVMVACEDRDDVNLTGLTTEKLSSKQGMKFFRLDNPFTIRIKPTPWTTTDANQPKSKILGGWLPTVNDLVFHYGLKFRPVLSSLSVTGDSHYMFTLMVKINVEAKHQD